MADEEPLVSIITPSLNQARFIERTLLSVKEQRYRDVEHLVIDGGSTDGTVDLLRDYEHRYNMRWLSEPDGGMYEAINKGLAMATGQILAYLNSDDYYLPWTIQRVVEEFERAPDVGAVFGDTVYFPDESGRGRLVLSPPPWLGRLQRSGFIHQPALFWRKEVLGKVGPFDDNLRYVGDQDFAIRVARGSRLKHVREVLAVDSQHAGSKRSLDPAGCRSEGSMVRARYHRPGRKTKALWAVDLFYWGSFSVFNRACLVAASVVRTRLGIRPGRNYWPAFITEAPFPVSQRRLLAGLLPGLHVLSRRAVREVPIYRAMCGCGPACAVPCAIHDV